MYPPLDARSLAVTHLIALWTFFDDDALDRDQVDAAVLASECLLALNSSSVNHPVAALLAHACHEASLLNMGSAWLERLLAAIEAFILTAADNALMDARGEQPSLGEYLRSRIHDITMMIAIRLTELSTAAPLPEPVISSSELRIVHLSICSIAFYKNDILSYEKETKEERSMQNVLLILQNQHRMDLEEATAFVHRQIGGWETCLRSFQKKLRQQRPLDRQLGDYLHANQQALDGLLWWMDMSRRYA